MSWTSKAKTKKTKINRREPNDLELSILKVIKHIKPRKVKVAYESERLPYHLTRAYVPDFVIDLSGGRKLYIEAKGYLRPGDRTKMIAVKKANPDLDIRFVFAKDNILYKGSKSRYSDWCKTNGFLYHVGLDIPKEWFR